MLAMLGFFKRSTITLYIDQAILQHEDIYLVDRIRGMHLEMSQVRLLNGIFGGCANQVQPLFNEVMVELIFNIDE